MPLEPLLLNSSYMSLFLSYFCKIRKKSKKQVITALLLVIPLLLVVAFVTSQRMAGFSAFDSIAMYYVAPFSLFNYYIENPSFSQLGMDGLQYGTATFGFIYNIIRSGLYIVFHVPYNGSDYIITQVTAVSVQVGSKVSINAGCTAIYIFMRDFGLLGIIIGFALMAFFVSFTHKRFLRRPSTRTGAIFVVALYTIFRLSSFYDLMSPGFFFTLIFIILLTKKPSKPFFVRMARL